MANKNKELLEAGGYVTDSTTGLMYPLENKDTIVEEVKTLMDKRSQQGIKEYGVTLEDNPDGFWRWVNELQTELLDAALYLQKLKKQK